ncbi:MAG: 30S ribosomal protein S3 [Mycoplasmoidaceae bacterium]|nr:MAG: 30S ribosomal protein S3 [Mycoplasmoidaceae bacterium]
MSQKSNPVGLRIGVNKNWNSRWTVNDGKTIGQNLVADEKIRKYFYKTYNEAQVVSIEIERKTKKNSFDIEKQDLIDVYVTCGQVGFFDEEIRKKATLEIQKIVGRKVKVNLVIVLHENVWWSARVVARKIADDIENRVPFRVAMKNAVKNVMMSKALGVKVKASGRLGGVEMARDESYSEGTIPLSTFRCDLDYAHEISQTVLGSIGVKVWINRGEIFEKGLNNQIKPAKFVAQERRKFNTNPNAKKGGNK